MQTIYRCGNLMARDGVERALAHGEVLAKQAFNFICVTIPFGRQMQVDISSVPTFGCGATISA